MRKNNIRKRLLRIGVIVVVLCLLLSICASLAYGSDLSTYMSGPGEIGAGEQFSVTVGFSCSDTIYGISVSLSYDSSLLSLVGSSGAGEFSATVGSSIVADSANGSSSGSFAVISFQATSAFSAGQSTTISFSGVTGSTGADISGSGCSTSVYISAPSGGGSTGGSSGGSSGGGGTNPSGSSDCSLSSLSVTGFNLTPAFSSSVYEYSIEVPFETTSLEIIATQNDANAGVAVLNNALKAGKVTDVTVSVTAENGTVANYVIKTTRKQDPNYVSSKNNYLTSLQVSYGLLSPAFDKDILNYVVDVPYNLETISFVATLEDPLASYNILGDTKLKNDEDNIFNVVCTAENNDTRIYTVTVRKGATYDDYLSKTYINTIVRSINDNEDPVVMNMANASVQLVSSEIFNALAGKSNTLVVMTKFGNISFKGSNIEYEIKNKYYDLTMLNSSVYSENILPSLASYTNFVVSTNYKDSLPGYATFSVYTGMLPDTVVNVYMYDPSENEYVTVAKSIKVLSGGVVSFEIDKGGDFVITTKDISGASDYSSVNRKGNFGFLNNYVIVIILLIVCLGIGFAVGMLIGKNKNQPSKLKNDKPLLKKDKPINTTNAAIDSNPKEKNKPDTDKLDEIVDNNTSEAKAPLSKHINKGEASKGNKKQKSIFSHKKEKNIKSNDPVFESEEQSPLEDMLDKLTEKNEKKKDE